jgi:signal transduction histidine kinase
MNAGHGMIDNFAALEAPQFVHLASAVSVGPLMTCPLIGEGMPRGAIVVAREPDRPAFTSLDLDVTESFANQAALALELADRRADQQRLTLLEDRDRIARDLHDYVIQRLFATGLSIQATNSLVSQPDVNSRLSRSIEDIDETIKQIRTAIFQLRDRREKPSIRTAILQLVNRLADDVGINPHIRFDGPLDNITHLGLQDDVDAVVRESLSNAVRHGRASEVDVDVATDVANLIITVTDNGVGISDTTRQSGIANLRARAVERGGELTLTRRPEGGTRLRWAVPLT